MKIPLRRVRWRIVVLTLLASSFIAGDAVFAQQIRVIASWPALADIARQVGKDLVSVDSLATGVEDAHGVPMKPSFVPRLNRADVLLLIGLDDEHSWLPALLEVANNPKILPGRPGYIDCSVGITVLEAPTRVDRAEGDLHPKGNPHYLLDPVRAKIVAQNIAAGLALNFPQHKPALDKNLKAYLAELDTWIGRWDKLAAPLRGVKYVEYHPEWVYLADRYGMKRIGSVEIKPGVEPTPNHIVELTQKIKQEKAQLLSTARRIPDCRSRSPAKPGSKHCACTAVAGVSRKPTPTSNGSTTRCVAWFRR